MIFETLRHSGAAPSAERGIHVTPDQRLDSGLPADSMAGPGRREHRKGNAMDFMGMMKQAAELKSKMEAMQAELDHIEVEGAAGGGMVTVRLTAKGDLKAVTIDASLMKPDEKEIVEDLVVTAHAEARRKAETLLQEKMQSLTGGLPLPPGLKLF
jgi:DNA-binding YbaB/EbfC family protein